MSGLLQSGDFRHLSRLASTPDGEHVTQPPSPPPHVPGAGPHRSVLKIVLWVLAGAVALGALAVGGLFALLYFANPLGDEWVCSQGETPAGTDGFYNQCFKDGADLPQGFTWDPLGNRPMSYNCDKHGWMIAHQTVITDGTSEVVDECVRSDTELPLPTRTVTTK